MRRHLAALGAATLLGGGLAACTSAIDAEQDPSGALAEAVRALGDYDGVELSLSLDGDPEALATAIGDEDAAQLLLGSEIVVRASGETAEDTQVELVVVVDGEDAAEVRVLPDTQVFVRLDLDTVRDIVDDPEFDASVQELAQGAQLFGAGELADAVVAGEWVQLTGLDGLADLAGGLPEEGDEPTEEEAQRLQEQLVAALEDFLDEDVAVSYVGSEDVGERVRATTDGAALQGLLDEFDRIASQTGVDTGQLPDLDDEGLGADVEVEIDAWLSDGRLVQVGFELPEEDDVPAGTFVLLGIDEFDGTVEAPDEAVEFDLFGLIGAFLGGFGDLDADDLGDLGDLEDLDDLEEPEGGLGDPDGPGDDGELPEGDPLGGDCIPQEQLDELAEMGGPEAEEAIAAEIEAGLIEVC